MAIGQGYHYHGSSGPEKVRDGRLWAWHGSGSSPHAVKKAWAYSGTGWKQWYPHGGGTVPPHPGGTHTATAGATLVSRRITWHISSSRHVKSQRLTVWAGRSGFHGKVAGHDITLRPNTSHTFTVSTSTRTVSVQTNLGHIGRASVRYTYT